ncbi:MAG: DUF1214 domain-containing protein [Pseudomonadales bacterium]
MKKIGAGLVVLVLVLGAYAYGTINASTVISTPPVEWAEGNQAAQSWREFTTSLEAAGARIFAATDDADERLEGLQFLTQIASASLEMKLAKGSTAQPQLTDWMADHRKFLGDSPDAIYHTAELSPAYRYEIKGNRGAAEYLGFMLYGRQLNGWNRAAANLSGESLQFDSSGNFRIVLSKTDPNDTKTSWLKLEDDIHMLMVRQYYHGRAGKTEASFSIRNLDQPSEVDSNETQVSTGLRDATVFLNETLNGAIALSNMLATAPNSIEPPSSYSADFGGIFYPTFDNEYFGGWFYLEDDEALVIEGPVPKAPYWGVSLQNRWMQSFDSTRYQTELNDHSIVTENGRYRIVVSHRQPSSGNWIDTAGKREGLLSIRYQLSDNSVKPNLTLMKFDQL